MNRKELTKFFKLMKIDVCTFLYVIGFSMHNVTVTQMMEDKMCLNSLNLDPNYCSNLIKLHSNETETQNIFKQASIFENFKFFTLNIPALILSIFLGYWLDNYPKYLKFMLRLALATLACMEILFLINAFFFDLDWKILPLSYVPMILSGGTFVMFSSCYSYISWSTPQNLLVIRFTAFEFTPLSGFFIATFAGGKILSMDPWIKGQPKNYIGVFSIGLISAVTGLIYSCFINLESVPVTEPDKDKLSFIQVIKDVFQFRRAKQPVKIFLRKRPNNGRLRLFLLVVSGSICLAAFIGEDGIAYQFAQRVYGLTEDKYTTLFSILSITPALVVSIFPTIFKSYLGFSDSGVAILGCLSMIAFFMVRGLFLSTRGYIAGFVLGSFCRVTSPSFRSLISGIVDQSESAQLFTFVTAFENYITLGAIAFYTTIFNATIDKYPGSALCLMGCLLIFPLTTVCWIEWTRIRSKNKIKDTEINMDDNIISNKNIYQIN